MIAIIISTCIHKGHKTIANSKFDMKNILKSHLPKEMKKKDIT